MKVTATPLGGLMVLEPQVFADERGFFLETWQMSRYASAGIDAAFVQDGHSRSSRGVLRGLHFTVRRPQAQLVYVSHGEIFDVAVDLRRGSPTFGRWHGITLSADHPRLLFLPPGFAHGFLVLSEWVNVHYKATHLYDPSDEHGLHWADPDLAIEWPLAGMTPVVKARDAGFPRLAELGPDQLPLIGSAA